MKKNILQEKKNFLKKFWRKELFGKTKSNVIKKNFFLKTKKNSPNKDIFNLTLEWLIYGKGLNLKKLNFFLCLQFQEESIRGRLFFILSVLISECKIKKGKGFFFLKNDLRYSRLSGKKFDLEKKFFDEILFNFNFLRKFIKLPIKKIEKIKIIKNFQSNSDKCLQKLEIFQFLMLFKNSKAKKKKQIFFHFSFI